MVIKPRVRGFVCITAHPEGCAAQVASQIAYVRQQGPIAEGPRRVLVIGASTGYGLSTRITAAFGCGAATLGVFYERPGTESKPASAGWYNSAAFTREARAAGLWARNVNGDAFSDEIKEEVIRILKEEQGPVDEVVYSLASPRRLDPRTGTTHKAVIKPINQSFSAKSLNTDRGTVIDASVEPADSEEIADTVKVMGGEDWESWIEALDKANLLAPGATSYAYSYIGPEVTWPVYKDGTIGRAKQDLEAAAARIDSRLKPHRGRAFISVNKAVVTQASSAIPVVPLYLSILYPVMKAAGTHEGCIEQIDRLYRSQLYNGRFIDFDEAGRVRLDDLEMRPEIQEEVKRRWGVISSENLSELADFPGYQSEFLALFGFGAQGVDYEAETNPDVPLE